MITRRPLFILLTLASFLLTAKQVPAQYVIGTTGVGYDQPNNTLLSYHATDFIDYDTNYWYDPYVQGFIIDLDHDRQVLSSVQVLGGSADYFVEAGRSIRSQPGQSYSIESDHFIVAYFLVQGCFSSGCGFYWYDPFGYNFASVGDVGGNFNFSPVGRISYLTFQAYYLGTTIIQVRLAGIPSISGISPSAGVLGQNVNATISGSNFGSSPTVQVSGNGVSANVTSASDTQINVSFSIAGNADLGQHSVTVGASNYTSNAVGFSVGDQTPQINGISPGSGEAGRTVGVTITGSGFGNRPTVSAGNGINVSVTSANNNQITANFTIARDTPTGGRTVTVTSNGFGGSGFTTVPGGGTPTSNGGSFNVTQPPRPTISSISPSGGISGQNVNVTIRGSNFSNSPVVRVSGNGIGINVTSASDTQINASFSIAGNADIGQHAVTVVANDFNSNSVGFTVGDPTPQITGITPPSGEAGTTVGVTITGSGFGSRPTVSAGGGINVSVTTASNAEIRTIFTIPETGMCQYF